MTPAEIIARAYDREQAAQMGEPDPWGDGTDHPEWYSSLACAQEAIAALQAAGFRLIPAGEYDTATIEAAAKTVADHSKTGREWIPGSLWDTLANEAAGRIRALQEVKR